MKRIILPILFLFILLNAYGQEVVSSGLDSEIRKQAESLFEVGDRLNTNGDYVRYDSNILIRLQGLYSKEDSMIVCELVDSISTKVDKWLVIFIPNSIGNLTVSVNLPHEGNWKNFVQQNANARQIVNNLVYLDLPNGMDYITRKKLIYYYVLRSMVVLRQDIPDSLNIPGSVFTEKDPKMVTFNPIDFRLIQNVYSTNKTLPSTKPSVEKNDIVTYLQKKNISSFVSIIAILMSYTFLIIMSLRGIFKKHDYRFGDFMKQALIVVFAISFYIAISSTFLYYRSSLAGITSLSPVNQFALQIVASIIIGAILSIAVFFVERAILRRNTSLITEILTPMFSIALIVTIVFSLLSSFLPRIIKLPIFSSLISAVGSCLLIGFVRSIYIFTRIRTESLIREKDLELAKISELHKQAELQSLRAKINPHFLYNALNSIASLATTDARKTEQMALALSDFFKYAINREQKQLNTLSEELNAVRTYLEIEKVRFGDRLSFEIDCPPDLLNIQIPQLLIQPLVENAIKHGLSQITENGMIRIVVANEKAQLKIRIYDNGPAFPDGPLTGFGIQNTQERIALLYGAKATINWQNEVEKYIEITLPL